MTWTSCIRAGLILLLATGGTLAVGQRTDQRQWITAWASAQQPPDAGHRWPSDPADAVTLRQVMRVTVAGSAVRLRLSNVFGTAPLVIGGVHVARSAGAGSAAIQPGTDRVVQFGGDRAVTVPAGADYWSDPLPLAVASGDSLAVTVRLAIPRDGQTAHVASHATSFMVAGDRLSDRDLPGAQRIEHWGFLSGIDVAGSRPAGAIVALGDSITDGSWSTTDGNNRWPDVLADRLAAAGPDSLAVLNLGIGGNRLLLDGNGPSALARFDRDVLAQSGVRFLILTEGINDIGTLTRDGPVAPSRHAALVANISGAYRQASVRARPHGIVLLCGTLTPFMGTASYHPGAASEADRQAVNAWIRQSPDCDGVIDFDAMVRDPAYPDRLLPAYDSGDHLHPSPAGYRRMGSGITLSMFEGSRGGPRSRTTSK